VRRLIRIRVGRRGILRGRQRDGQCKAPIEIGIASRDARASGPQVPIAIAVPIFPYLTTLCPHFCGSQESRSTEIRSVQVRALQPRMCLSVSAWSRIGSMELLVDTFTGYWLAPFARPGRKRLLTTPRFYYFDIGVRNAAAGLPLLSGLSPDAGGALLEQWVGLELIHRAGYSGRTHGVSFWRTTTHFMKA
jgi:hypothetical protein